MTTVSVGTYTRAHTSVFVSDKLRNLLKVLVWRHGLDPTGVVDAWNAWVDHAARTWLQSGHLRAVIIEFYWPGARSALARWDFPIRYDGTDVDEMWTDRSFFHESFPKAKMPPSGCAYRIVLSHGPGAPHIAGLTDTRLRSVDGLVARETGTVIATPDIMASARYYR